MINAKIVLPQFQKEFEKNIKDEVSALLNKKIPTILSNIKVRLQELLRLSITNSPEYQSIVSGILRVELGIQDTGVITTIVDTWANNIKVEYKPKSGSLGVISIGMIDEDYSDVLNLAEASYSYSTNISSGVIEWLRWLLIEGSSVIVVDYEFKPGATGRLGQGSMINRVGGGWSIPSQFAGTATDNFATRALISIDNEIDDIVRQEITRGLR